MKRGFPVRVFPFKVKSIICLIVLAWTSSSFAASRGEQLFSLCIQCHGPQGYGNKPIGAPAIAGLPEWYISKQLETFAAGGRGKHPDDDAGNRMRPMARTLQSSDIKVIAAYVSGLKPATPEVTLDGVAERGKAYYVTCSACHGADGAGNMATHAPPLKISNDWYLIHQLKNFKNKIRAYDPAKDPIGATMAPMAMTLPDEQAMKDVIAYVQSLKQ
jgi:cytochrome c553